MKIKELDTRIIQLNLGVRDITLFLSLLIPFYFCGEINIIKIDISNLATYL